jgi:3alpha(or 20beta)-hydroxysteroid dehydrogenase
VGRRGIRVNALLPGFVATDLTEQTQEASADKLRELGALPRPVTGEDVAGSVAFLLSDSAASITGQGIPIDGGASI